MPAMPRPNASGYPAAKRCCKSPPGVAVPVIAAAALVAELAAEPEQHREGEEP